MKDNYVQAIIALLNAGRDLDAVLEKTVLVMKRRGHYGLYGPVLKQLQADLEQARLQSAVTVTVARAADVELPAVASAIKTLLTEDQSPVVKVDETIIGGAIIKKDTTQLDLSYKTALYKLYKAITA